MLRQRITGDVKAEQLFLEPQQVDFLKFLDVRQRRRTRGAVDSPPPKKFIWPARLSC
jgi:hypothetical protein